MEANEERLQGRLGEAQQKWRRQRPARNLHLLRPGARCGHFASAQSAAIDAPCVVQLHEVLKDDKRIHPAAIGDSGAAGAAGGRAVDSDDDGAVAAAAPAKPKEVQKPQRGVAAIASAVAEGLRAAGPSAPAADPGLMAMMQQSLQQSAAFNSMMGLMMVQIMSSSGSTIDPAMRDAIVASLASGVAPPVTAPTPSTAQPGAAYAGRSEGATLTGTEGLEAAPGAQRVRHVGGSRSGDSSSSSSSSSGGDSQQ